MKYIRTACPWCGRVELYSDDITLVVNPRTGEAWYVFDCIGCVQRVARTAPEAVAAALAGAGVLVSVLPAEVWEEDWRTPRRLISTDDLLDALLLLGTQDDLADQAAAVAPPIRVSRIGEMPSPRGETASRTEAGGSGPIPRQRNRRNHRRS